jgi:hypothetical protein
VGGCSYDNIWRSCIPIIIRSAGVNNNAWIRSGTVRGQGGSFDASLRNILINLEESGFACMGG